MAAYLGRSSARREHAHRVSWSRHLGALAAGICLWAPPGTKRFLIKCQPREIPDLREELGDAGIAFWTFANGADEARNIMETLT
jgi:hypothetical protein